MFSVPLLFMLYGTTLVAGRNGPQQRQSDLQFAPNTGYAPRLVDRYMAEGLAQQASKITVGPPGTMTETTSTSSSGGGEVAAGSLDGGAGEVAVGMSRRRMARRLISNDDEEATVRPPLHQGSVDVVAPAVELPLAQQQRRLWPCHQLREPAPGEPRAWLYTLLGADYEGTAELLPHWLRHYLHTLGFSCERLLVVVNHHSTRPETAAELAAVQRVLEEWGIQHLLWTGRYSSDAHLKVQRGGRSSFLGWEKAGPRVCANVGMGDVGVGQ
jgi:hypothetical protein